MASIGPRFLTGLFTSNGLYPRGNHSSFERINRHLLDFRNRLDLLAKKSVFELDNYANAKTTHFMVPFRFSRSSKALNSPSSHIAEDRRLETSTISQHSAGPLLEQLCGNTAEDGGFRTLLSCFSKSTLSKQFAVWHLHVSGTISLPDATQQIHGNWKLRDDFYLEEDNLRTHCISIFVANQNITKGEIINKNNNHDLNINLLCVFAIISSSSSPNLLSSL